MNYTEFSEKLWLEYKVQRHTITEKPAFEILLRAFPALLVAQADGFADASELQRVDEIINFLCRKENIPTNSADWRSEVRYLVIDSAYWRQSFLEALHLMLKERPELYFEQAEFMYAVAAASTGDVVSNILLKMKRAPLKESSELPALISDKERQEIDRIIQELGFGEAPDALAYLHHLLDQSHG
ncbi:MAG: hypothetical protein NZ580_00975 [Bacteroidia bacterium]|nr:hypothetical protein [Bacteroidia bacterium]MDW8235541.1 hypothetical protein [Bacteroidia bacterium]